MSHQLQSSAFRNGLMELKSVKNNIVSSAMLVLVLDSEFVEHKLGHIFSPKEFQIEKL